jgi:hypothetical protein
MTNNNPIDPELTGLTGKALEKPPAFLNNDQDIKHWVRRALNKLEQGADAEDPSYQLACFLAASSVVGPDEDRIARMFGLSSQRVALWAENLRRGQIWQDGMVCCEVWHHDQWGFINFIMAMLLAEGLVERRVDDGEDARFGAIAGPQWWQNN